MDMNRGQVGRNFKLTNDEINLGSTYYAGIVVSLCFPFFPKMDKRATAKYDNLPRDLRQPLHFFFGPLPHHADFVLAE